MAWKENSLLSFTTSTIDSSPHQVDKIVDQLQQLMQVYDLAALRDYWNYLERRLFSRLEDMYRPTINKPKTSLFRFYLVYTIQVLVGSGIPWWREFFDSEIGFLFFLCYSWKGWNSQQCKLFFTVFLLFFPLSRLQVIWFFFLIPVSPLVLSTQTWVVF